MRRSESKPPADDHLDQQMISVARDAQANIKRLLLYGATNNNSPTAAGHLVIVDRATALVTDIGSFAVGNTMSDITFDRTTGILYGLHSANDHWLYTINLATGAATQVGTGTRMDFGGGGLAASAAGVLFVTPDGHTQTLLVTAPTLRTVDKTTGNSLS